MGARSRLISTQALNLGWAYAVDGAGINGDILFVRPNGKALKIGRVGVTPVDVQPAGLDTPLVLPPVWCLAPGEDIVFRPQPTKDGLVAGTALYVPTFVDVDLINFRIPLDTSKQIVLQTPPGKVWQLPGNLNQTGIGVRLYPDYRMGILNLDAVGHDYKAYINDGISDVEFDSDVAAFTAFKLVTSPPLPDGGFLLPAGHSLKVQITSGSPLADTFFCATMAEYNQAEVEDETFATPTVAPTPP
jgi:hypothetical protein